MYYLTMVRLFSNETVCIVRQQLAYFMSMQTSVASSDFSLSSKFSPNTALTIGSEGQWGFEKWTKVDP